MKLFELKPQILTFTVFKEFAEAFKIGKDDLILTNEFLFEPYMKSLNLKCDFIFQEKYGLGEPSDEMINSISREISGKNCSRIVGVGGGTIIDIAKILALKNPGNVLDLFEGKAPVKKDKKLIIIPTTCGTGSEVTNISIAEIKSKHTKMGLTSDELYADYAVLIPELVRSLPYKFFVTSSIDALIHAVESYVSPKSNPYTELFSLKAMELILKGYMYIVKNGPDRRNEILDDFITGSNLAGIAFSNTGVGAVHALSYPLGGNYHVPHGEANYLFFTEVFRKYNEKKPEGKIKNLNKTLAELIKVPESSDIYSELSKILDQLLARKPLKEYGMKEKDIEDFADNVIETQQRLLVNNYVNLSRDEIRDIFKKLF